ncbi:cytochrome C biogenesis protein CcdA [Oceanobacillus zhaokaii]|uniref:Cytochrome C biogenesis protein CcdA n=1 Tax=Oceanobacillus zhaokaii TaxID=2052660 RepID=A0A345PJA1_9BACI|nr:cytochrome c biogenesis protein CcdA [Oceanobacillus zhaokaii]AXI10081.1 cytochrome C biogenesis protein CcdA [Oceanobacillus zhaokaii]
MNASDITLWIALFAGSLTFLSPCTLPIFPAYLSYITGMSLKEIQYQRDIKVRRKLLLHSIFFLLGVSMIFLSLGFGATLLGQWVQGLLSGALGIFFQRIAGIFIIVMGLFVAGWLPLTWFMKERRFNFGKKRAGYVGTFIVGMGFAAGWTPCIGPIFASILVIAGSNSTQGIFYTIMYVVGFAIPFIVLSFFLGSAKWLVRYSQKIMKAGGSIMILTGIFLYTGQLTRLSIFLFQLIQDSWLSNIG